MRATITALWAPKDGNTVDEYEDAWCLCPPNASTDATSDGQLRIVVCDGATESYLAGRWARSLASTFAAAPAGAFRRPERFGMTAAEAVAKWPGEVADYVADREARAKPLKWYERPGLARGAFATLLAIHVSWQVSKPYGVTREILGDRRSSRGRWHAAAFGDACLFHVRGGELQRAFPLSDSADFNNRPPLLCSNDTEPELLSLRVQLARGTFIEGDDFYCCTDALAAWVLQQHEAGCRPWGTLDELGIANFETWLLSAREENGLRNDDVTLVHVKF